MKLLFDESMPWPLRRHIPDFEVWSTQYLGWDGKGNGELLALARERFDVLVTVDQGIPSQRNITREDVAVIVLKGKSNDVSDLKPLIPQLIDHLRAIERGDVVEIEL